MSVGTSEQITGRHQAIGLTDQEIIDPISGEVIDLKGLTLDGIDLLWDRYERSREMGRLLELFELRIRAFIQSCADGTGKTLRVRGRRHRIKVELPDDSWNQSKLKEAVRLHANMVEDWIRVSAYAVNMREWKKILNETGPADFEAAKKAILECNEGPRGPARISLEEVKS